MTVTAASNSNLEYNIPYSSAQNKEAPSLFNNPRATESSQQVPQQQGDDKKTKREKELISLAAEHKLQLKDIEKFLKIALEYTLEKVYELSDEEYRKIADVLIPSTIEAIEEKYDGKCPASRLMYRADKIKELKDDGKTIDEIAEQHCTFGDEDILGIIEKTTGKKYKSVAEISDRELEAITRTLLKKLVADRKADGTEKSRIIMQLMSIIDNVSSEDYKKLYTAFLKTAPEADNDLAVLLNMVKKLKDKPEEFQKFLEKDLAEICRKNDFDYEKMKGAMLKIAEAARDSGFDDPKTLRTIFGSFKQEEENTYKSYKERQKKGENLSETELEFIKFYELKQKEKNNIEELSDEEKTFLAEYRQKKGAKLESIREGFIAAFSIVSPKKMDEFLKDTSSEELERILYKIYDLHRTNPEYKLDIDTLDKITDGKFSSYEETYESIQSTVETPVSSETNSSSIGYGYNLAPAEIMENASENAAQIKNTLTNTETQKKYVVEKSDEQLTLSVETVYGFTNLAKDRGWKYAAIEAGKQFQTLRQDTKSALKKYIDDMFKNDKGLLDFARACNNSALGAFIALKFDDGKKYINLLYVGKDVKNVAYNNYEELHKNELEKKKNNNAKKRV